MVNKRFNRPLGKPWEAGQCNGVHIKGNRELPMAVDMAAQLVIDKKRPTKPDVYFPPNTSLAMVCSCMFEVPS